MQTISNTPFLRILLPFLAGILLKDVTGFRSLPLYFLFLPLMAMAVLSLVTSSHEKLKLMFLVCADIFLILYSAALVDLNNIRNTARFYGNNINPKEETVLIATINNTPEEKAKTIKCRLQVNYVKIGDSLKANIGNILVYFRKGGKQLRAGQTLLISCRPGTPESAKNPYEFDYASYLANKGISHTAFVESSDFMIIERRGMIGAIRKAGLVCRDHILSKLRNSSLSKESYGICSALLTGFDADVGKTIADSFSRTGTLHVLSVSGLHTGLIYLALNFLLNIFDRKKRFKSIRFVIITVALWSFALITGFAAPVLRAVIMFNLLGFGRIYYRAGSQDMLNILFVSAFILLSYDPLFIKDVGFLLSFTALGGLICFQPVLSGLFSPKNKILAYCWQSITASFAATISTLPVTLYFFKQFPFWFFVCNLVVVPLIFVMLFLAVVVVAGMGFPAVLINWIIRLILWFLGMFDDLGSGYADMVHFTATDALLLSVLIISSVWIYQARSFTSVRNTLLLLIGWQLFSLYDSYKAKSSGTFTVYSLRKQSAISLASHGKAYTSLSDSMQFSYHVKPHLTSFNYPAVIYCKANHFQAGSFNAVFLEKPGYLPVTDFSTVNTVILANGFRLGSKDLASFRALRLVIADGSNDFKSLKHTREFCRKHNLEFHSTFDMGAFLKSLN